MPETLVKLKTGTIAKLEEKNQDDSPKVPLDEGTVYFAVDTTNHTGKIVYDAPDGNNGVDRIAMGTLAEYSDAAGHISGNLIDGLKFDGQSSVVHYAVCATAANTQHKTVICPQFGASQDNNTASLVNGARIIIRYENANTATNPTLTINNGTDLVGASQIPIYYINSPIDATKITANSVHEYVYDSSIGASGAWIYVGTAGSDTNITIDENVNTLFITSPIENGDGVSY